MHQKMLLSTLKKHPDAVAQLRGNSDYPNISGCVRFYQTKCGVLISAEVNGLPKSDEENKQCIFAFHIHDGSCCTGTTEDPFANTMSHYNTNKQPHPNHAGDLPPLFGNDGYAFQNLLTNRFSVQEILNKTILIHSDPDDFTTQPSGNSGKKIACGEIKACSGCGR